ncbi:hypothetical protein D3C75_1204330 [compost metagenome]
MAKRGKEKLSRSPPHEVETMTSGRSACRRLISVEKSAAPNLGNISATTLTSGLNFFNAARKMSRESRPQA